MSQIEQLPSEAALVIRPERTLDIIRGTCRLLVDLGASPILEWTLANGRRADIAALDLRDEILIVEVKSCRADFEADDKWQDYLAFADRFYFAVDREFPQELLPEECGLIISDRYGGAILRESPCVKLAPARRKAAMARFARHAADRLILSTVLRAAD
ncbi:MAG: MmcB family DNA repair protein [Alphaproteobacteria bacterium]